MSTDTDSRRYRRIKDLVIRALELPPDERDEFLRAECDDDAMRHEVDSLLSHDEQLPSRWNRGVERVGSVLRSSLKVDAPLPDRIGPYTIHGVLGRGGMGIVYEAEQHEPIQRRVALKSIKAGLDTERIVARFESERQSLAMMDHPLIAKVLDAGADDLGRPYFAMEKVEGRPITEFCHDRGSSLRERLKLFLLVGEAVTHAHQRGVIHRDLKPSNVLVAEDQGRALPKVIDFGIAKATTEDALHLTQEMHAIGTPEYMSPEQAGLVPGGVDTRTDVYSLGILLYELLSGEVPRRFDSSTTQEIHRIMQESRVELPSVSARARSQTRLARSLEGDLDNIVMRAIRTEPERRYGSVQELTDDIGRYLDGHPVRARPDTWTYRTGKFVRRHLPSVTAALVVFASLAALGISSSVQSRRIARERDRAIAAEALASEQAERARTEAATSSRVADFLVNLFQEASPYSGEASATADELLQLGVEQTFELTDEPLIRARLQSALGKVHHARGSFSDAERLLELAIQTYGDELGETHPDFGRTVLALATLRHDQGLFPDAITLREKGLFALANDPEARRELAIERAYLAATYQARRELEQADTLLAQSLVELDQFDESREDYAWTLNQYGYLKTVQGEHEQAIRLFKRALSTQESILPENHPDTAGTLNNLGGVHIENDQCIEAEPWLRRALDMYRALYRDQHAGVGRAYFNLGRCLHCQGRLDETESLYRTALEMQTRLLGETHIYVARVQRAFGTLEQDRGNFEEAKRRLTASLSIFRGALPEGAAEIVQGEKLLAECLAARASSDGLSPRE